MRGIITDNLNLLLSAEYVKSGSDNRGYTEARFYLGHQTTDLR